MSPAVKKVKVKDGLVTSRGASKREIDPVGHGVRAAGPDPLDGIPYVDADIVWDEGQVDLVNSVGDASRNPDDPGHADAKVESAEIRYLAGPIKGVGNQRIAGIQRLIEQNTQFGICKVDAAGDGMETRIPDPLNGIPDVDRQVVRDKGQPHLGDGVNSG